MELQYLKKLSNVTIWDPNLHTCLYYGKALTLFLSSFNLFSAGVFCAVVSHPADTVVSKLNNDVGSSPLQAARDLGMRGRKIP